MAITIKLYLSKEDEKSLINLLMTDSHILLLRQVYYREHEFCVEDITVLGKYPSDRSLAFSHKSFRSNFEFFGWSSSKKVEHNRLNIAHSPVVTFSRPRVDDNEVFYPGTLSYTPTGKQNAIVRDFCKWAHSVVTKCKSHLTEKYVQAEVAYLGGEAVSAYEEDSTQFRLTF